MAWAEISTISADSLLDRSAHDGESNVCAMQIYIYIVNDLGPTQIAVII